MHPFLMAEVARQRQLEARRASELNRLAAHARALAIAADTKPRPVRVAVGKRLIRLGLVLTGTAPPDGRVRFG